MRWGNTLLWASTEPLDIDSFQIKTFYSFLNNISVALFEFTCVAIQPWSPVKYRHLQVKKYFTNPGLCSSHPLKMTVQGFSVNRKDTVMQKGTFLFQQANFIKCKKKFKGAKIDPSLALETTLVWFPALQTYMLV